MDSPPNNVTPPPTKEKTIQTTTSTAPDWDKELQELFYNIKTGYVGAKKLYYHLQQKFPDQQIPAVYMIQKWLNNQETVQVNKRPHKPKLYQSFTSSGPGHGYQMDILIYSTYEYKGWKYMFVLIDIYSRYAQVRAMKSRTMKTWMEAFEDCLKKNQQLLNKEEYPRFINSDNEFAKSTMQEYCKKHNIQLRLSEPEEINKNAIVERFNRTLREKIHKYRFTSGDINWPSYLQQIVEGYNTTLHSTTKQTPYEVFTGQKASEQIIHISTPPLDVGHAVRIIKKKKVFDKGDINRLSTQVYTIESKHGKKYGLEPVTKDSGADITTTATNRTYKPYELKRVDAVQTWKPYVTSEGVFNTKNPKKVMKNIQHTLVSRKAIEEQKQGVKKVRKLKELLKGTGTQVKRKGKHAVPIIQKSLLTKTALKEYQENQARKRRKRYENQSTLT